MTNQNYSQINLIIKRRFVYQPGGDSDDEILARIHINNKRPFSLEKLEKKLHELNNLYPDNWIWIDYEIEHVSDKLVCLDDIMKMEV